MITINQCVKHVPLLQQILKFALFNYQINRTKSKLWYFSKIDVDVDCLNRIEKFEIPLEDNEPCFWIIYYVGVTLPDFPENIRHLGGTLFWLTLYKCYRFGTFSKSIIVMDADIDLEWWIYGGNNSHTVNQICIRLNPEMLLMGMV